jgi:hypothetical protein
MLFIACVIAAAMTAALGLSFLNDWLGLETRVRHHWRRWRRGRRRHRR